jgi:hypothetical protein
MIAMVLMEDYKLGVGSSFYYYAGFFLFSAPGWLFMLVLFSRIWRRHRPEPNMQVYMDSTKQISAFIDYGQVEGILAPVD